MKYMCLVYAEPSAFRALSDAERAVIDRDSAQYDKDLEARGHYIHSAALQAVSTAKTVRRRAGKVTTTDGPFAETKEVLCGFILIEAADQDEALKIAADIPMARVGSIEVRAELDFV
ncbi:MAG TPA: YciI family protein [Phenylobacterium sp.]|nr:YciI family protein [Phenylobacterium sp.]